MKVITEIGVWSMAKLQAVIMAVIGLIVGIIYAALGMTGLLGLGSLGGSAVMFIIIMPALYALMGFVGGALGAWLYNIFSSKIGGVEIELEEAKKK